jgi:hypothetical protein
MKHHLLSVICAFAMITAASAQTPSISQTMKLYDNRSGEVIGTATFMDRRTLILRDLKGEVIGMAIFEKDGSRTFRDANGKPVDTLSIAGPIIMLPEQND